MVFEDKGNKLEGLVDSVKDAIEISHDVAEATDAIDMGEAVDAVVPGLSALAKSIDMVQSLIDASGIEQTGVISEIKKIEQDEELKLKRKIKR